ncbi:hypothetical protein O181_086552 [Austropuccinia psidii MF-1]|uniref:Uncharacterized protein n=1 Tax=Austropuccinia psidii MF-1 TaxID=1389203 RepID=A0A9Q3IMH6_9BASI|nr:hypothetical protein [Austropuccinia psidii MF-1]
MRLQHCPPISVLTTPYTFTPPALTIFMLTWCPPDMPTTPLAILTLVTVYHPYAFGVHSRHAPDIASHPYARGVPSPHAPDTTYSYACVVPSQHAPDTAAHPYACGVPSQHAPNTTYPYSSVLHP